MTTENENQEPEQAEEKPEAKSATIGEVKEIVNDAIEAIKNAISPKSDESDSSDADNQKKKQPPLRERARSLAAREDEAEDMVKSAVKAALGEVEEEKEVKVLKAEKKKQETQKPPAQVRKLTSFLLGKGYMEDQNK